MSLFKRILAGLSLTHPTSKPRQSFRRRPLLETLEDRTVPAIGLTNGVLSVTGTNAADQVRIQLKAGDATTLQVSDNNGSTFQDFALSSVNSVNVMGTAGTDTLTLNLANGLINSSGGTSLQINFTGGTGKDTLIITGNPSGANLNETYTLGTDMFSGILTLSSGSNTTAGVSIHFTTTESILDIATATNLTINGQAQGTALQIVNGPAVPGLTTDTVQSFTQNSKVTILHHTGSSRNPLVQIQVDANAVDSFLARGDEIAPGQGLGTGQANGFVPITFANKATVTINGQGGNDVFALNVNHPATGLTNLQLNGGGGTDVLLERNLPGGVTLTPTSIENIFSNSNDLFIEDLYQFLLHRVANTSELSFWQNILSSPGGAQTVVQLIEESLEARTLLVLGWYQDFLGRHAQGGEEQFLVHLLQQGISEESTLALLFASGEFGNFSTNLIGGSNTTDNLTQSLYLLLLNRTAGQDELNFWGNTMHTRGAQQAAQAFEESGECRSLLVMGNYQRFLHRTPDQSEVQFWVNSNLDQHHIRQRMMSSGEFENDD